MAKSIVSKNVTQRTTNSDRVVVRVSSTESIYDSDITFMIDNVTSDHTRVANLGTIENVMLTNGGTVDGIAFTAGKHDFSEIGGLRLSNPVSDTNPLEISATGTGVVIVTLRF